MTRGLAMVGVYARLWLIENMSLNTGSAISRIQDLDYAKESTAVARQQILKNAGLAVHAQRKAMGSDLLSLL